MNTDPMTWRKNAQREIAESVAAKLRAEGRQATDGGRNPLYEGLFEGETEQQRTERLATVQVRHDGWPLLSVTTDKPRPGSAA